MLVQDQPPIHLTYCLNVHPGESWAENLAAIKHEALRVRSAVEADLAGKGRRLTGPFGLGLRLSNLAARELAGAEELKRFRDFLSAKGLYVFTINGFPYGQFHRTAVKHDVYRPDWSAGERLEYTCLLADILSDLLPEGMSGSISTVPVSYKGWLDETGLARACANLASVALHLRELRDTTGRDICLALEPEPDCLLETTAECIDFLTGPLAQLGRQQLGTYPGLSDQEARRVMAEHVGVCVDTAHLTVEFEEPAASLRQLREAGIRVGKIQLSAALRVRHPAEAAGQLAAFCDPVYLHQTKARDADGRIRRFADLPDALAQLDAAKPQEEWRVHFHVPLFFQRAGGLESTSSLLDEPFWALVRAGACPHLEIETYTFTVLPPMLAVDDVCQGIAREYQWVLKRTRG